MSAGLAGSKPTSSLRTALGTRLHGDGVTRRATTMDSESIGTETRESTREKKRGRETDTHSETAAGKRERERTWPIPMRSACPKRHKHYLYSNSKILPTVVHRRLLYIKVGSPWPSFNPLLFFFSPKGLQSIRLACSLAVLRHQDARATGAPRQRAQQVDTTPLPFPRRPCFSCSCDIFLLLPEDSFHRLPRTRVFLLTSFSVQPPLALCSGSLFPRARTSASSPSLRTWRLV